MNASYKLTIAVITMNRAEQLKNALESCLLSELPECTQFVIVDNASSDHTAAVVEQIKKEISYDLVYHKENENRGVGGGRNICFDLANGEYVYFLDDDAEIAEECRSTFFMKSIDCMDKNPQIATLTTEIVDPVFGHRSQAIARTMTVDGLACVYAFHGGTVFIRKSCFSSPLFLNIMYGNEELALSMSAVDKGYFNVYDPTVFINHFPKSNKWTGKSLDLINIQGINTTYNIKRMQYPVIFRPVIYMAYKRRLQKYGGDNKEEIHSYRIKNKAFLMNNQIAKIKISTVIRCYREFGLTVF